MSWATYWNEDWFWSENPVWDINASLFLDEVRKVLFFRKNDIVLDIGCGAGYLEKKLAPLVKRIYAADLSSNLLQKCAERCKEFENIKTVKINHPYTDLSFLNKRFNLIFCVSVIQYYKSISEVEELITSAQKIVAPGAKMLIADIPQRLNFFQKFRDLICSIALSIQKGYFVSFFVMSLKTLFFATHYKKACKNNPQLYLSKMDLENLLIKMGLKGVWIRRPFSVCVNRLNLLIEFL